MIKKTLYLKIVSTFLVAVIIGVFVAFFISWHLYRSQMLTGAEEDLLQAGKEIVNLYQKTQPANLDEFFTSIALMHYKVGLYDSAGGAKKYGASSSEDLQIEAEQYEGVLRGEIYRGMHRNIDGSPRITIGLPFKLEDQAFALFIEPEFRQQYQTFNKFLHTVLFIVLIVGSIIFVVLARYIVKPIKHMTFATKEFAKGNFEIDVNLKSRDELGMLAESMNQMAKQLSQLDKMRNDFISDVSHEFRSPLTSIQGFSQALKDGPVTEEEKQEYLQIIQNETERLSKLSENLLRLAYLDSEQYPVKTSTFSLDEQIRRVILSQQPQWTYKKLVFDISLPKTSVSADESQLEQIWTNLISNSIKYTPEKGEIYISIQSSNNEVCVGVRDTGIGIPKEDLNNIFKRFYKVDKSRDRSVTGSGLGLSIVEKIVTLHGGSIRVESQPGKGTEFTICLPKTVPPI